MRKMFPGTPILGLTATATSRVVNDVQKILDIQGCLLLKASFNRPNLIYQVPSELKNLKNMILIINLMRENNFVIEIV